MILSATKSTDINNLPASVQACKYCLQHNVSCIKPAILSKTSFSPSSSTGGCIRKQIMFVQLFAYFPLIGIVIPNAFLLLADTHYSVPLLHWVLCFCLLVVIGCVYALKARYAAAEFYQKHKRTVATPDMHNQS